ncbi:uncharacterized protein LOC103696519 isoform X2 [Phoenix dactylifera]|uniref:Uncharacterized protein LOC103696519 isoform X2 n=1 Tax=Phoenix dactylifera TaxID=42345 RepID=A0A8B8ZHA6_PHODC|nr:uncharacterized protein LOC103696519 isoform X2 [Phoenix dactylifera]
MKSKHNGTIQRAQRLNNVRGEGPTWVLIAGGALLSTLSIRLGCKLKQVFETKRQYNAIKVKRSGAYQLHSNCYCFTQDDDNCYHCCSGGGMDIKLESMSPMLKEADLSLSLVKSPIWTSSTERIELPQKPFHLPNSSDSPCISESGSDIYTKREVIHKLRQQLKRRDEMIMEMQAQITDLQNSVSTQMAQLVHLQSQLDSANRQLFDSEREIQRLRKVIADNCVAGVDSPEKPVTTKSWHPEAVDGQGNGYPDSMDDSELHYIGSEKVRGGGERVLERGVGELKELTEGKDFLLQSCKEQKMELCSKIKELQLKFASQLPNIL